MVKQDKTKWERPSKQASQPACRGESALEKHGRRQALSDHRSRPYCTRIALLQACTHYLTTTTTPPPLLHPHISLYHHLIVFSPLPSAFPCCPHPPICLVRLILLYYTPAPKHRFLSAALVQPLLPLLIVTASGQSPCPAATLFPQRVQKHTFSAGFNPAGPRELDLPGLPGLVHGTPLSPLQLSRHRDLPAHHLRDEASVTGSHMPSRS